MTEKKIVTIDEKSQVPLFGLDFLGIIDRGTNVLEVKPLTICQFHCKYCFVAAGDYHRNYFVEPDYLVKWIEKAIDIKDCADIEIHFAPYGEIFLYSDFIPVIRSLKKNHSITSITAQSNGMLITPELVKKVEEAGLDRLNISLNSMDEELCADLCGMKNFDLDHLLNIFDEILNSSMQLCIAPVWFMGKNDQGIIEIIEYVKKKEKEGYLWPKLRLGIQNYLEYKTGRKLGNVFSRDFGYFYHRLEEFEKNYNLKLKLGPLDFGIHSAKPISSPFQVGDTSKIQVLMKGRFKNEYIAALNKDWAVKVLSDRYLKKLGIYEVKYIKSSLSGNLLTAYKT